MLKKLFNKAAVALAKRSENSINVAASDAKQSGNIDRPLRDGVISVAYMAACTIVFGPVVISAHKRLCALLEAIDGKGWGILENPSAGSLNNNKLVKAYKTEMNQWK